MFTCKFCNKECKNTNSHRNHERLCPSNPDRKYVSHTLGINGHVAWNKGLTKETSDSLAKASKTMKRLGHGGWSKTACSNGGKAGGGYRENAGRSKKFRVLDSFGKETVLQSTYELKCSEILNELKINWIRPKALKYDNRNYFADFYLTDYDIWLDPKNSYKAKKDEEKIRKVIEQNNIKLYVLLEKDLNKEYIARLAEMD
jgi:hypothetical protein